MNAQELAQLLSGIQYPVDVPKELRDQAKAAGLVIVYGSSDDLVEFDGVFRDEASAPTVRIDADGIVPEFDQIDKNDETALRDYFRREGGGRTIEALWCAEPGYSWTYRTDIPHQTFEILEGEAPYCRGLVFSLSDVTSPEAPETNPR